MTNVLLSSPRVRSLCAAAPMAHADRPGLLHVVLSLAPGGTERLVIEMSRRLEDRYRIVICCLDEEGSWASELTERGVAVVPLHRRPGFRPSLGLRIAAIAEEHRIQLLHCHHYSPFVYGLLATQRRSRLRLVFTEHGRLSDAPPSKKRRLINPVIGRFPGRFFAVSEALRRHMMAEGFPGDRVSVIYNGIDPGVAPTAFDRQQARRRIGIVDEFVVGTVARLDPVKDLGTLVDAFARVRQAVPNAVLVIIGEGPQRAFLERRVHNLGLGAVVKLLGYQTEVRRLLPAFDAYVNSSTNEGVSLTILEAMGAGLPVVATGVGGNPETVCDGETGLIVPVRDSDALARSIIRLAGAPGWYGRLGQAGRRRVEQRFTLDRMVEEYVRAYAGARERA